MKRETEACAAFGSCCSLHSCPRLSPPVSRLPSTDTPSFWANRLAFLWVVLPKTNLYINEPLLAEFRLYFRSDVRRYGNLQLPLQGNGLAFSKPVEAQSYQRRVGNAVFTVLPLSVSIKPFKT